MHNIGLLIKQRREELGWTQEELAHKVGYKSRASINKIELQRDVPIKKLKPIADVLGIDIHVLCGYDEEEFQADKKFSIDNARFISLIRNDEELTKALTIYFSLPDDKKKYVTDLIKMLGH